MAEEQEQGKEQGEKVELSKEDLEAINKDINTAKDALVSKEQLAAMNKIKEEAKQEAQKEVELQQKLKDQEAETQKLKEELEAKNAAAAESLQQLQSKVDDMITSKATVNREDPFKADPALSKEVEKWSEDKVNKFEEQSAKAFFGEDYDDR